MAGGRDNDARTATATSDRGYPGRGWAILSGVVTVIAGVITPAYPFDSIAVLTHVPVVNAVRG